MLTKKQLIAALADFADDAPVLVFDGVGLVDIADLNPNGKCVQVNTDMGRDRIDGSACPDYQAELAELHEAGVSAAQRQSGELVEDERPCYLHDVEDGNETPFDEDEHKICLLCAAKLRALGMDDGIDFEMGPTRTFVVSEPVGGN